mmetsp:Transcript_118008/g.252036  ORF Transcript_118008/g.252036 Transcript_118008/m.252036 type:complete len:609 (-) Transcript_118008:255-2081(-)
MGAPWRLSLVLLAVMVAGTTGGMCPGMIDVGGHGSVSIVPTGWNDLNGYNEVAVKAGGQVVPHMGGRAYFAEMCTPGVYDHNMYTGFNLLGKTLRYTTDLSKAECGCNAALYLTSMRQNTHKSECGDYYCDANNVCGESCTEIDMQEGNLHSWHSTLHTSTDKEGMVGGYGGGGEGWNGPRDWSADEYGPGARCIDTTKPFEVDVSFPTDKNGDLRAMEVELSQSGSSCPIAISLSDYMGNISIKTKSRGSAMAELTEALKAGMTPVISYWSAADMLWLDGMGSDSQGHCGEDAPKTCGDSVKFHSFSIKKYVPRKHPILSPDWHDMGAGCCQTPDKIKPLFTDSVDSLKQCQVKCREFTNCGYIDYGGRGGSQCTVWPDWMDCSQLSTAQKCGEKDNDDLHVFRYKKKASQEGRPQSNLDSAQKQQGNKWWSPPSTTTPGADKEVIIIEASKVPPGFSAGNNLVLSKRGEQLPVKVVGVVAALGDSTHPPSSGVQTTVPPLWSVAQVPMSAKDTIATVLLKKDELHSGGPIDTARGRRPAAAALVVAAAGAVAAAAGFAALLLRQRSGLRTQVIVEEVDACAVAGSPPRLRGSTSSCQLLSLAETPV